MSRGLLSGRGAVGETPLLCAEDLDAWGMHADDDIRDIELIARRRAVERAARQVALRLDGGPGAWILRHVDADGRAVEGGTYRRPFCSLAEAGQFVLSRLAEQRIAAAEIEAPGADGLPAVVDAPEVEVDLTRTEGAVAADALYGGSSDYHRDTLIAETRHFLGAGVMAMLEAGGRLIRLKEHEEHGSWAGVLRDLELSPDTAQRMMRAARKFLAGPHAAMVRDMRSVTAVYELAMSDDEDLHELRQGGTIAGSTLDDLQTMTPSQLRDTLRRERAERRDRDAAHRLRVRDRDREVSRLQDHLDAARQRAKLLSRPGSIPVDRELADLRIQLDGVAFEAGRLALNAAAALRRLRSVAERRAAEELAPLGGPAEGPGLPPIPDADSPSRLLIAGLREQAERIVAELRAAADQVADDLALPIATERQPPEAVEAWDVSEAEAVAADGDDPA